MKLVSRNVALLLFATISIVSCKDDDEKAPDNKFAIGDNSYKIAKGVFLKDLSVGEDDNGNEYYRNELAFITDGINVIEVDGETEATGEGNLVSLLINNEGQELEVGTYTWQSEENEQPFDFWAGDVVVGWNSANEGSGTDYEFQSGTVTVAKSGDKYIITFEGVAIGDANHDEMPDAPVTVSGQFEGKLMAGQRDF
jgi:hypothetical protein